MKKEISYLIGLMCGRGHINKTDNRIIIEFAHKNKTIQGIAYCPDCGDMATERRLNNPLKNLYCKSCGKEVDKSVKKTYEQYQETKKSLRLTIIPFLEKTIEFSAEIVGNEQMTFLILEFSKNNQEFYEIADLFKDNGSFDSFSIPLEIYKETRENQVEFVNGFMDTAGFFNAGGWLNRDGEKGTGRMRAYFQIVRNWEMPVLICNFLKGQLLLPIQTIDWGHPNIRDSNMQDYYTTNPLSWSREHQVKFFPEYYREFKPRLKHKMEMFYELINHNQKMVFKNIENCNSPYTITKSKLKPIHFGESDPRIPEQTRNHCDAFWQVCYNMGCTISHQKISDSHNPDLYYLTGEDKVSLAPEFIKDDFQKEREKLTGKILVKFEDYEKEKQVKAQKSITPEQALYEPIAKWFEDYLSKKFNENVKAFDTSSFYLIDYIQKNNLFDEFSFSTHYKIKPDVVGFLLDSKRLAFVEVKVGELTLRDLGQLLGYCLVAKPEAAFLISPKSPSINLLKILKSNPSLLRYDSDKFIQIETWSEKEGVVLNDNENLKGTIDQYFN